MSAFGGKADIPSTSLDVCSQSGHRRVPTRNSGCADSTFFHSPDSDPGSAVKRGVFGNPVDGNHRYLMPISGLVDADVFLIFLLKIPAEKILAVVVTGRPNAASNRSEARSRSPYSPCRGP